MGKKTKAAVLAGVPTAYGEISFDVGLASEPSPAPYAVTPLEVNAARIHAFVESGVPVALIPALAAALGLAPEVLALRCGLSRSTFHRKLSQPGARLDQLGSDLFVRYAELLTQALDTFSGNSVATKKWLNAPRSALGNAVPLEYATSTAGYAAVRTLLGQIDRGVYV